MILNDSQLKSRIISTLRRLSWQWAERSQALKNAKCGKDGRSYLYLCAYCKKEFKKLDIAIDHINPVVPIEGFKNEDGWDWHQYIKRMFSKVSNFQILCKNCHEIKCNEEKEQRRKNRAQNFKARKGIKKKKSIKKKKK